MEMKKDDLPVYKAAMEAVAEADLRGAAQRLGLRYDEGVHLDFLLKPHVVTNEGVFRASGKPASQIVSALLIQYCLSDTASRPSGNFVSMSRLAGPGSGIGAYFNSEILGPMDRAFSRDMAKLETGALALGAKKDDIVLSGGVSFVFEPLKHIPVQLVFFPGDDEFPAGGSILLDESAIDFLGFETLAFLVTILFRKLIGGKSEGQD